MTPKVIRPYRSIHSLLDFTTAAQTFLYVQIEAQHNNTTMFCIGKRVLSRTKMFHFCTFHSSDKQQHTTMIYQCIMINTISSDNQYINRFIMPWILIFLQVWLSLMLIWCIYHRSKFNTMLLVCSQFEHVQIKLTKH